MSLTLLYGLYFQINREYGFFELPYLLHLEVHSPNVIRTEKYFAFLPQS